MRKRRIIAKVHTIARDFLSGKVGACETCLLLSPHTYWTPGIFSDEEKMFLKAVNSETDNLPIGRLAENWHPDFLPGKLAQIEKYDAKITSQVRALCEAVALRKMAKEPEGLKSQEGQE